MKNTNNMKSIHDQLQQIIDNQVTKEYFDNEISKLNTRLNVHEEQIKDLEKRVKDLESSSNITPMDTYDKMQKDLEKRMKDLLEYSSNITTTDIYDEMHDQESRKNNVMILGMPEETGKNNTVIFQKERRKVQKLLSELEITNSTIKTRLFRIGTKQENVETNKPRPLRITLDNNIMRNNILKHAKNLKGKDTWKGISIVPDMTKMQQNLSKLQRHKLLMDAQKRNRELGQDDIDNGVEYKVIGHYGLGTLRVIKTFKNLTGYSNDEG